MEVNGRVYPMWGQFVKKKIEWVGGKLEDLGDGMDRAFGIVPEEGLSTSIIDIDLVKNGEDSASFQIVGKDFTCAFDVKYGGITGGDEGYITFSGYNNHIFRIKKPVELL